MIFQADKCHNCNDLKRKKAESKPCLLVNNGHQIGEIQGAYRVQFTTTIQQNSVKLSTLSA